MEESIDCTFISGTIWKTYNNNIQEKIDCILFCSESIWKTGNFAAFYWKCTTQMKFHFLFHLWRKKVFHCYYWDTIEESIDCTFTSGTIWKTNNDNIQEEIDCTLFCSENIWMTGNFAGFDWKCTTKMKFHRNYQLSKIF